MPSQEDITAQQSFLQMRRDNVALLKGMLNHFQSADVPVAILNGISETREEIRRTKSILRAWGIEVADHPDDEGPEGRTSASPQQAIVAQDSATLSESTQVIISPSDKDYPIEDIDKRQGTLPRQLRLTWCCYGV